MKMIHDFKKYDRLIYVVLITFAILMVTLLILDGYNSSLTFNIKDIVKANFSALRYACILYYTKNNKFPDTLEELIKEKYVRDVNLKDKKFQYKYENKGDTFQLSVTGLNLFKDVILDLKHDNKVNQIFIDTILKMKDKNLIIIEADDNNNFELYFPESTSKEKQEEITKIIIQYENSINRHRDDPIKLETKFLSKTI